MALSFIRTLKSILCWVACILLVIGLCSCESVSNVFPWENDAYAGKRPDDYPSSKWVCSDPDIVFTVDELNHVSCKIDGDPLPDGYILAFGQGTAFWIHDNNSGKTLFYGESTYASDKMTVLITQDNLFAGSYEGKTIVFRRQTQSSNQGTVP